VIRNLVLVIVFSDLFINSKEHSNIQAVWKDLHHSLEKQAFIDAISHHGHDSADQSHHNVKEVKALAATAVYYNGGRSRYGVIIMHVASS